MSSWLLHVHDGSVRALWQGAARGACTSGWLAARAVRPCALTGHRQVGKAEYWLYTYTCNLQPVTLLVPAQAAPLWTRQVLTRLQAQGLLTHCLQLPSQMKRPLPCSMCHRACSAWPFRQRLNAPPRCSLQVQRLQRFATYGLLKQVVLKMIADELQDASADDNGSETTNMVIALRWAQLWEEWSLSA